MTVKDFVSELQKIVKVHPEAGSAQIWVYPRYSEPVHIVYVGYDKRHHPNRIKLEEEK